jgi:integrase
MKGHIHQRGKDSWRLKFDLGSDPITGKRRTKYVTVRGGKREAQDRLNAILAAIGDVGDDKRKAQLALARVLAELAETPIEPTKLTVEQHVLERITQWQGAGRIGGKTAERYGELAKNQINPHLGTKLVADLKPLDIENWHTTLKTSGRIDGKGGLSPRTIRHAHRLLSKALKDAVKNEQAFRNVAALEGAPRVDDEEEVVILTDERVSELLTKLRGKLMYVRAITSLFTGLRRGELLALRWRNAGVDGTKTIRVREALEQTKAGGIRFKKPKTKRGLRDITLPDIVVNALRDELERQKRLIAGVPEGAPIDLSLVKLPEDALVFGDDDGEAVSPRAFSKQWAEVAASIGMPDVTLHALRHTHASQLIDQGVDVVTISKRLGHASPTVTLRIYAHLFRKDDGKASEAINAALARLGGQ